MFQNLIQKQMKLCLQHQLLSNNRNVLTNVQSASFTRAFRKIVLTQDVENIGFKGEICFVKPGRAFNELVPKRKALFFSDPNAPAFIS